MPKTFVADAVSKHIDMASLTLRPVRPGDGAFLLELYSSTRMDEVAAWGWDPSQRDAFLNMQFAAQRQSYRIQYPEADHQIIRLKDRMIGRIMVARKGQEIRLVDISLMPDYRNAGVGTFLIERLLAESAKGNKPVRLQVLKSNRAVHLYHRLGFSATGGDDLYLSMEWHPNRSTHHDVMSC